MTDVAATPGSARGGAPRFRGGGERAYTGTIASLLAGNTGLAFYDLYVLLTQLAG
jgi:hypothetical protein